MQCLPATDCHLDLWITSIDEASDPDLLDRYAALLAPDEIRRWKRFVFEKDRRQFLIARALARAALSSYTGSDPVDASAWSFQQNEHGRPAIAAPRGIPLTFNVSHSGGIVVCLVATERRIGVDVEHLDRKTPGRDLARRYFAADEVADLKGLSGERLNDQFFRTWTLKESYIKALGVGLSLSLSSFAFSSRPKTPPRIAFPRGSEEDPSHWQFATLRLGSRYRVAWAIDVPETERLTIGLRTSVPLRDVSPPCRLPTTEANHWEVELGTTARVSSDPPIG